MPGSKRINLTGMRFGSLQVLGFAKKRGYHYVYRVKCDCGEYCEVYQANLRKGATKSCGCERTKHGHYKGNAPTRTYNTWQSMKKRCYDISYEHYYLYGERGIVVCDIWIDSFERFLKDMGERPEGKTLDRIDTNGNYEPDNCKWSTYKEQSANRRKKC